MKSPDSHLDICGLYLSIEQVSNILSNYAIFS